MLTCSEGGWWCGPTCTLIRARKSICSEGKWLHWKCWKEARHVWLQFIHVHAFKESQLPWNCGGCQFIFKATVLFLIHKWPSQPIAHVLCPACIKIFFDDTKLYLAKLHHLYKLCSWSQTWPLVLNTRMPCTIHFTHFPGSVVLLCHACIYKSSE